MKGKRFITLLYICLLSLTPVLAGDKFVLVLDAGHGGHDPGCVGAKAKEKTLTLRYALAFGRIVESHCPDVVVYYTRKTDKYLTLKERADFANNHKADLFVSVHINALPGKRLAHGYQTYTLGKSRRDGNRMGYIENLEVAKRENSVIFMEKDYKTIYQGYDPNSPESNIMFEFIQDKNMELSAELARYLQRNICQTTGRENMGAHQDNLAVLRLTSMPGCLMELGFVSTPDEENFMLSESSTEKYARGFYNAFIAYKNKHHAINSPYRPLAEPEKVQKEEVLSPPSSESVPVGRAKEVKEVLSPSSSESVPAGRAKEVKEVKEESVPADRAKEAKQVKEDGKPVFKVQILTSSKRIKAGDARLKGEKDVDCYEEGGLVKYTVGASENYQEISRLRKQLTEKFPEAFVIAFRNGQKMNVNEAIQIWKNK